MKPGVRDAIVCRSTSGSERHAAGVHAQDLLATLQVGAVHDDLAVEAPGPHERGVEHVGPVRRGHDDHALARVEAVHLDQQLVQGLLALVVGAEPRAAHAGASLADRVDLVEEDQRRRLLLRLLEQLADPSGAQPDEHLDELRARHEEERDVRLAGDRAREQGLAAPGRTQQQHALGDAPAEPLVLLRVRQEVDDLAELVLGLVHARDVGEGGLHLLAVVDLDLVLAHVQRRRRRRAHAAEDEPVDEPHHQHERQDVEDERREHARLLELVRDVVRGQQGPEVAVGRPVGGEGRREVGLLTVGVRVRAGDARGPDREGAGDVARLDVLHEVGVVERDRVRVPHIAGEDQERQEEQREDQPGAEPGPRHAGSAGSALRRPAVPLRLVVVGHSAIFPPTSEI